MSSLSKKIENLGDWLEINKLLLEVFEKRPKTTDNIELVKEVKGHIAELESRIAEFEAEDS